MATKRPRYMISVDNDMFNAIEDFRFEHRFQTRSEATAELIRLGLEQLKKDKARNEVLFIPDTSKELEMQYPPISDSDDNKSII